MARLDEALSYIVDASKAAKVDPSVVSAIFRTENRGNIDLNPALTSPAGARGLMQLKPIAIKDIGRDPDSFQYDDPADSIDAAIQYVQTIRDRYGFDNPIHQIAAYNMGPGALREYLNSGATFDEMAQIHPEAYEYLNYAVQKMGDDISGASQPVPEPTPETTPQPESNSALRQLAAVTYEMGPRQLDTLTRMATGDKPIEPLEASAAAADLIATAAAGFAGGPVSGGVARLGRRAFQAAIQGGATTLDSLRVSRQANKTKTLRETAEALTLSDYFLIGINTLTAGAFGASKPGPPPPPGPNFAGAMATDIGDVAKLGYEVGTEDVLPLKVASMRWNRALKKQEGAQITATMRALYPEVLPGQSEKFFEKIARDDLIIVNDINNLLKDHRKSFRFTARKARPLGEEIERVEIIPGPPGKPDKTVRIKTGQWQAPTGDVLDLYRDVGAEVNSLQKIQQRSQDESVRLRDLKRLRGELRDLIGGNDEKGISALLSYGDAAEFRKALKDVRAYNQALERGDVIARNFHPGTGAVNPVGLLAELSPGKKVSEKALRNRYGKVELAAMRDTAKALTEFLEEAELRRKLGGAAFVKAMQQSGKAGRGAEAVRGVYERELIRYEKAMTRPESPHEKALGTIIGALYGAGGYAALGTLGITSPGGRAAAAIGTAAFLSFASKPRVAKLLRKLSTENPASRRGMILLGRLVSMANAAYGDASDKAAPQAEAAPRPQTTPMPPPPVRVPAQ